MQNFVFGYFSNCCVIYTGICFTAEIQLFLLNNLAP